MRAAILLNVSQEDELRRIIFTTIDGVTMVERVYRTVKDIFGDVSIVGGGIIFKEVTEHLGVKGIMDPYSKPYFLSNLAVALRYLGDDVFVFSPNMPCINSRFVDVLRRLWKSGEYLIVAPGWQDDDIVYGQAIYSYNLLSTIEQLVRSEKGISDLISLCSDRIYVLYLDRLPMAYTSSTVTINGQADLKMFMELLAREDTFEHTCKEMFKEIYLLRRRSFAA